MNKNIIFIAILIRLIVMPWFYHPDIKSTLFHTQYLSQGIFDIYSFLDSNRQKLPYTNIFVYLPFTYYFLGTIDIISKPFYPPAIHQWLNDWSFFQNNNPNLPTILFILKLPYLFFDLATAYLIYLISRHQKFAIFWLLNPITIYLIYIQGNFDIIPCFFTLLCWYFLIRQKFSLGYLSLGVAIALKIYPILFLPFFLIKYSSNLKHLFLHTLTSFSPLFVSVLPFITHPNFYSSFIGSGLTQKLFELKILAIPLFPVLYLTFLVNFFLSKTKLLEKYFILLFFLFISVVKFHPQWLIWFLPFITPYFFSKSRYILISIFILCLGYIFLINDNFLFWGHLAPIDWEFTKVTSPYNFILLKIHRNPDTVRQLIKSFIPFVCLLFCFYEKKSHSNLH